jgi:hypothetical protein
MTSKRGGESKRAPTGGRGALEGRSAGVTGTSFFEAAGVGEEAGGVGGGISATSGSATTTFRRLRDSVAGGVGSRKADSPRASRRDTGPRVVLLVLGAPRECGLRRFLTCASACRERGPS